MKIEKCHIENFGKLCDLDISFEDGLNEICAGNGAGKSTLSAFIRAMLYGFEGDGKHGLASERRRYSPWQGGPFGGSMTFCANGRSYKVIRRFADKAKSDEFLLYDAQTNLPCSDHTENLGKELFLINKETFERTVFIEAGDCKAAATGDVNKMIGNLTEDSNDINNYEAAQERLKDLGNKLGTKRNGQLRLKKDKITDLKKTIADGEGLGRSIEQYENMLAGYSKETEEYKKQLAEITKKQTQEAEKADLRLNAEKYNTLCENAGQAEADLEKTRKAFPGEVPDSEKISEYTKKCEDLNTLGGQCSSNVLSAEEEDKLAAYKKTFADKVPDEKDFKEVREKAGQLNALKEETPPDGPAPMPSGHSALILIIAGAAAAALGIAALVLFGPVFGIILFCVAAALLIFGAVTLAKDNQKKAAFKEQAQKQAQAQKERKERAGALEKELSAFFSSYNISAAENDLSGAAANLEGNAKEYLRLSKKKETYLSLYEKYSSENEEIISFIKKYSGQVKTDSSLTQQIIDISHAFSDLEAAKKRLAGENLKKEEFENSHDIRALAEAAAAEPLSLGDLQNEKAEIDAKLDEIKDNMELCRKEADRLRAEYDERSEKEEELKKEQKDCEELELKCANIKKAADLLEAAKASLIKKYTDPILESFRHYFSCFSEETGKSFQIDANLDISRQELGMPRKTETQSSGLQDMMGFCLRAAYIDAMYLSGDVHREKPVLILDDPFMALDGENSKAAGRLLKELAEKYQVIYFTCSPERKYS